MMRLFLELSNYAGPVLWGFLIAKNLLSYWLLLAWASKCDSWEGGDCKLDSSPVLHKSATVDLPFWRWMHFCSLRCRSSGCKWNGDHPYINSTTQQSQFMRTASFNNLSLLDFYLFDRSVHLGVCRKKGCRKMTHPAWCIRKKKAEWRYDHTHVQERWALNWPLAYIWLFRWHKI